MRRRSIFGIIVLSIITCGIYYLIAWVQVFSDINYGARENDTAITDLLLSFVTCGIWGIFCFWKYSKKLCIMQSSINDLIDRTY